MTKTVQLPERLFKDGEIPVWVTYSLTDEHAQSSYGRPVLVGPDGTAYGPDDRLPNGDWAALAVQLSCDGIDDPEYFTAVNRFVG